MRPTLLQFRSPKERTPDCYNPTLTYEGRRVSFSPVRINDTRTTFSNAKRFTDYDIDAKKTGYFVGPGSYKNDVSILGRTRIKGTHVYKPISAMNSTVNDNYIMVGDQVVFDSFQVSGSKKNSLLNLHALNSSFRSSHKRITPRMKSAKKRTSSRLDTMATETGQTPEKHTKTKSLNRDRSTKRMKSPYLSRLAKDT